MTITPKRAESFAHTAEAVRMADPSRDFVPGGDNGRAFRDALGQFATGVTVVTCATPDGPLGMTANSFASLSLDPPLVLWSPAKASSRHDAFVAATHFAIHVISDAQVHIATAFARSGGAFEGFDWTLSPEGVPLIDGSLARFSCTQEAHHDGGDHTIIVGRVTAVNTNAGAPLCFQGGAYGAFRKDG